MRIPGISSCSKYSLFTYGTIQPGYITGQTLRSLDSPGEYLVISTWINRSDWNTWYNTPERRELQQQIADPLGEKTHYRFYEPLVGSIIPVFNRSHARI